MDSKILRLIMRPREARVILGSDAAHLNAAQIAGMCARWTGGSAEMLERVGIHWSKLEGEAVCRARDIVRALDMGLLPKAPGPGYKIFQVRVVEDLDALPICRDRDVMCNSLLAGTRTFEDHFRAACQVISAAGASSNSALPVSMLSHLLRGAAWAARDGDPRHGRVSLLVGAIPFEVCIRVGLNEILYCRFLKRWR